MKNKTEKYILMYKDDEVLSFSVTFGAKENIKLLEKLKHFDKAPYGMKENSDQDRLSRELSLFIRKRSIAPSRWDYQEILKYTKCKSNFELAFKGHGLSLSNHYWYKKEGEDLKYDDINFFTNKWDDSFAKAVLKGDYQALERVDLNVPDVVTPGWAVKGWIWDNGPKLYKLGIAKGHYEEQLGEVLASRLAQRMLGGNEVVHYELKEIFGQYASVSSSMLGVDEDLVPLSKILHPDLYDLFSMKDKDRKASNEFFEILKEKGYHELYEFFVKLSCLRSLCFVNDLHFDNLSIIRNLKTGENRIAPLYDLAGSFGGSERGRQFLSNLNKGAYLIIYFVYGNFDKDWDYSWYDPDKLIGFEDEIRETLSKSDFYTPELIDNIIAMYQYQKSSLDDISRNSKK